jgi:hypothetical protein
MLPELCVGAGAGPGAGDGAGGHAGKAVGKPGGKPKLLGKAVGMVDGRMNGGGPGSGPGPASVAPCGGGRFDGAGRGPGIGPWGGVTVVPRGGTAVGGVTVSTLGGVAVAGALASISVVRVEAVGGGGVSENDGDHVPVTMRTITTPAPKRMGKATSARMRPVPPRRGWLAP